PLPFDRRALRGVHARSGGVPRRINLLCDRALLGAYAAGRRGIDEAIVDKAAREVFDAPPRAATRRRTPIVAGAAAAAVVAAAAGALTLGAAAPWADRSLTATVASPPASAAASMPTAAALVPAAASAPADFDPASEFGALIEDEDAAWRQLAAAWKLPAELAGDPCA